MELIDILKKLRAIKADSGYTKESRSFILSSGKRNEPNLAFFAKELAIGIFRSGWSIALTAVLLLLTMGSFSIIKVLHPVTSAVVDVAGMKAEAQAIDAQIELNNVEYVATGIVNKTSTASMALPEIKPKAKASQVKPGLMTLVETTSTAPTIDSVLETLSE